MNEANSKNQGYVSSINGSVIKVKGLSNPSVGDMVTIDKDLHLTGEILKIENDLTIIQCYENTSGLKLYSSVMNMEQPLSMELGPGLLKSIYDGIQRPLDEIAEGYGDFIARGVRVNALDREKKWHFIPLVENGVKVSEGDVIGKIKEFSKEHEIMIPPGISGIIENLDENHYTVDEEIYTIKDKKGNQQNFKLFSEWSIRKSRPYKERLVPTKPLITGTRVIDLLFPVAQGGTVAVPGGFGTGKTVVLHTLAKFADADVIVYIGCGERGNEMADLLNSFPKLEDPTSGKPLIERTIMIANTSNMPVAAREASIFSGITIAEYWRDMGKNVLLLADSTSRWAEALREISGRLEEMPAEGGYPAYLADRLSAFYERAGLVKTLGGKEKIGSITVIGAVSPPSGDFSEPVTSNTKRFVRAFWALDQELAYARHYPSINPKDSYSLYEGLGDYWENEIYEGWQDARQKVQEILSRADELEGIAKLVGEESLPPNQQLILFTNELINNGFLIQNAFNENDRYSTPEKTMRLINLILKFHEESLQLIQNNIPMFRIKDLDFIVDLRRARLDIHPDNIEEFDEIKERMNNAFNRLREQYIEITE